MSSWIGPSSGADTQRRKSVSRRRPIVEYVRSVSRPLKSSTAARYSAIARPRSALGAASQAWVARKKEYSMHCPGGVCSAIALRPLQNLRGHGAPPFTQQAGLRAARLKMSQRAALVTRAVARAVEGGAA